jgi:hypothetical protein
MKDQITWPEYIKDYIELYLYNVKGRIDPAAVEVIETVKTFTLEDESLGEIIESVMFGNQEAGNQFEALVDKNLAYYCDTYAEDLQESFPEQWQEYNDSGLNTD